MSTEAIKELEAAGYIVIPPSDIPEVIVDESELLARVSGMDQMVFSGGLISSSVSLPSANSFGNIRANHNEQYEYRRAMAHLAMLIWYRENLEHEEAVLQRAKLIAGGANEFYRLKKKGRRKTIRAARADLRDEVTA